jgi:hypothetical protein
MMTSSSLEVGKAGELCSTAHSYRYEAHLDWGVPPGGFVVNLTSSKPTLVSCRLASP